MATLHPALLSIQPTSLGVYRERDVLAMLELGLPDGFDVFHSVDWSAMHLGKQSFGEVDVVVMGPGGHVTLLEVKAGAVVVSDAGLTKTYGSPKRQTQIERVTGSMVSVVGELQAIAQDQLPQLDSMMELDAIGLEDSSDES